MVEGLVVWVLISLYNDASLNVTVNGDSNRAMVTNVFFPSWNGINMEKLWFQQGGPTCHIALTTVDLFKTNGLGRVMDLWIGLKDRVI